MRNVCRHQKMAPLMSLDPDTVYSANEWIAGVAGGSVGVLGTLIQLELKQVRRRSGATGGRGVTKALCVEGVRSTRAFRFD